ncbi:MAG: hypothetical protein ACJAU0_000987 [Flavobacteriales bacterium]|jgi:hypothetical protein
MENYTLNDLSSFYQRENQLISELFNDGKMVEQPEVEMRPSDTAVSRILGYNKALSMRKSKKINYIQLVLN